MVCYLPLELVKKTLPSQKGTLLSVQSIHRKHNNRVNKHSNKHTTNRKHTSNNHNKRVSPKLVETRVVHKNTTYEKDLVKLGHRVSY